MPTRVELVKNDANNTTLMKACTKCKEQKKLEDYPKCSRAKTGRAAKCKECKKEHYRKTYETVVKPYMLRKSSEKANYMRLYRSSNSEIIREYSRLYKARNHDAVKRNWKDYYSKNRISILTKQKPVRAMYYRNNKALYRWHSARRRAKLQSLKHDMSREDIDTILSTYDGKCALTGSKDVHLDHFIPVSWGLGGSYIGNMYPLRSDLNLSKHANNPFEWVKNERIKREIDNTKWDALITRLATENGMSLKGFIDYVYKCERERNSNTALPPKAS